MHRAFLPRTLALTVLIGGLGLAGAQQTQPAPDANAPQGTALFHHRHAPNPERQAKMLGKRLNLTPDQTSKIEPILADREQKVAALRENAQLSPDDRRQQMRSIHEQTEQQLAGVLTPDQMTQLKSMRHRGHGRHGEGTEPSQAPSA